MKYLFKLLIFAVLFVSCSKKEVKIPLLAHTGLQEVKDFSQVWIFFTVKGNDTIADVNRKNTISSTNWVYNIDRRLPLKLIVPSLVNLKDKHANSMHSKEGTHDYFSYSDSISKTLSFFEFDSIKYNTSILLSSDYINQNQDNFSETNNVHIVISASNICVNGTKIEIDDLANTLKNIVAKKPDKKCMLHLNFSDNLMFQDYLNYRLSISNLVSETIKINTDEFIVDHKIINSCANI